MTREEIKQFVLDETNITSIYFSDTFFEIEDVMFISEADVHNFRIYFNDVVAILSKTNNEAVMRNCIKDFLGNERFLKKKRQNRIKAILSNE